MRKKCKVEGCSKSVYEKGYCTTHYRKWLDTGLDPSPKPVLETKAPRQRRSWHGTANGYSNYNCRCDDCRKAHSEYMRKRYTKPCTTPGCPNTYWQLGYKKSKNQNRLCYLCWNKKRKTKPEDRVHGTESTYNYGCRCELCVSAASQKRRERRHKQAERKKRHEDAVDVLRRGSLTSRVLGTRS